MGRVMGCCFSKKSDIDERYFDGQGRRLGSADENAEIPNVKQVSSKQHYEVHQPMNDPTLNDADRAKMRAERAEKAESRLKAHQFPKKKKRSGNTSTPLRGPNPEI